MKHSLGLCAFAVVGIFACSSKSSPSSAGAGAGDNGMTDPTVDGGDGTPGDNSLEGGGPTGSDGGPSAATNPIAGIAAAKLVLDTGEYTDGPIWGATASLLYFTTPLGAGGLYAIASDGTATQVRAGDQASGAVPIGNTLDKAGHLITLEAKRVTRTAMAADAGAMSIIASGYPGDGGTVAFDTLNDGVMRADGTMYITDPGYFGNPEANRLYRVTPAGQVIVADTFPDLPRPNGIALTPDQKTLYVGFTAPLQGIMPYIAKYAIAVDGTLGKPGTFVTFDMDQQPDGIEVDQNGNVYVATKSGVTVFGSDATKIGNIAVPDQATGMAFGDKDLQTLYVTTQGTKIYSVHVNVPGIVQ